MLGRVKTALPALLKDNKADIIHIMAAINDVTDDDYLETLTMSKLVSDVVDILTDGEMQGFLTSVEPTQQQ
jgi:hypothetical protein